MGSGKRPYQTGILIDIDPGEDTGWARWDFGSLVACGLLHPHEYVKATEIMGIHVIDPAKTSVSVLIEDQHILRQSRQEADPNKILKLAHKAGAIGMALQLFYSLIYDTNVPVDFVKVATWKGSRPKSICHAHMLPNLTSAERGVIDTTLRSIGDQSQRLDVKDAVCLGLWGLGRAR